MSTARILNKYLTEPAVDANTEIATLWLEFLNVRPKPIELPPATTTGSNEIEKPRTTSFSSF